MQALADMDNIVVAGSAGDDIGKQCGGWTITWQGATGNTTPGTTIFSGLKAAMDKRVEQSAIMLMVYLQIRTIKLMQQ